MSSEARQTHSPPAGRLTRVIRGRLQKPLRVILYATDGLGKSTFASKAPSPIFLGAEDGTAQLDVERMPELESWQDILSSVDELTTAEHAYKTIVLDTADWAEPMCWAHVAREANKKNIEELPYGRGYSAALDQWRILLSKLERLRNTCDMHVVILAHTWVKLFKNPEEAGDFDRYEMKLHAKASGLLREWADCVLFGNYETYTHEANGRTKGISTGARVIHTQRRAAFDAKNRFDLPETLPLDWDAFAEAVAAHRPGDPVLLKQRIATMLESVNDSLKAKVFAALSTAGNDAAELARIASKLSGHIATQEIST